MSTDISSYMEETRKPAYTAVLVLPFLLVYEVGQYVVRLQQSDFQVRNGGDAIVRAFLFPFATAEKYELVQKYLWPVFSALILVAVFAIWVRIDKRKLEVRRKYVPRLFLECLFLAVFLMVVPGLISGIAFSAESGAGAPGGPRNLAAGMVLSCGAGVYEEFVFRFWIVSLLALLATKVIGLERVRAGLVAVTVSAVLFSLIHFGGTYGDSWNASDFWWRFTFRAIAGLFFSALYYFRSFGVAVGTHAIYDILITLVITTEA